MVPAGVVEEADEKVVALPWHTVVVPVVGNRALTLTVVVAVQPRVVRYCMTDVPADTPVTKPVTGSIVATDVLLLLHVPPGMALLRAVVLLTHTVTMPVIGATG